MLRFNKAALMIAGFVVIPCMIFGTACTLNPSDPPPEILPAVDQINSPVVIHYLVKNPLEVVPSEEFEGDNYRRTLTINGLVDQEVETSINNALEGIYAKILEGDLPPYRGIHQKISSTSGIYNSNLDASMSFNYNNVASVLISGNRTYVEQGGNANASQTPEEYNNMVNVGSMEAYNVNLNTGEQITLENVFADDADYKTLLNDYIAKILMKSNATEEEQEYYTMGGNFKLVAPFKGISDNQKFFLYQGGLGLIFDYTNPEFDTNLYPNTIYINFKELGDVVAITERFYEENSNLYQSDREPVYEFAQSWDGNDYVDQKNEVMDNVNIYQTLRYNHNIPGAALEKAESLYVVDENKLEELKKFADPTSDIWTSLEQYVWTNVAGEYTTVTRNNSMSYNGQWKAESESYCYDADGNEIGLKDLFVPDYDYKSIIMGGLKKAINQMPTMENYDVNTLYDGMQFSLGLAEISFTTIPVKFADTSESPVYFSVTFEEIGCNNLLVFH